METPAAQQPWYATTRGCSFCTSNCPQWCYYLFPPPPPLGFFSEDPPSSSGASLSPLVIALIGILASALLLAAYYLLISRYCGGFGCLRRHRSHQDDPHGATEEEATFGALRSDPWQQAPAPAAAGGLEEWIIRRIAVCRYKKGDGLVECTDCSVCLGEFRDGESLRLLPDCLHAFHVSCIDTWLKSHSNCPLCRATIAYTDAPTSPPPPPRQSAAPPASPPPRSNPPLSEIRHDSEVVHDVGRGREEERCGLDGGVASVRKGPSRIRGEFGGLNVGRGAIELSEEGIRPDAPRLSSASGVDVFRTGRVGGPQRAGNGGAVVEEVGSSRGLRVEQHAYRAGGGSEVLHCVVSLAPAEKRSFAGGRFCFAGQGRGNQGSILPL